MTDSFLVGDPRSESMCTAVIVSAPVQHLDSSEVSFFPADETTAPAL